MKKRTLGAAASSSATQGGEIKPPRQFKRSMMMANVAPQVPAAPLASTTPTTLQPTNNDDVNDGYINIDAVTSSITNLLSSAASTNSAADAADDALRNQQNASETTVEESKKKRKDGVPVPPPFFSSPSFAKLDAYNRILNKYNAAIAAYRSGKRADALERFQEVKGLCVQYGFPVPRELVVASAKIRVFLQRNGLLEFEYAENRRQHGLQMHFTEDGERLKQLKQYKAAAAKVAEQLSTEDTLDGGRDNFKPFAKDLTYSKAVHLRNIAQAYAGTCPELAAFYMDKCRKTVEGIKNPSIEVGRPAKGGKPITKTYARKLKKTNKSEIDQLDKDIEAKSCSVCGTVFIPGISCHVSIQGKRQIYVDADERPSPVAAAAATSRSPLPPLQAGDAAAAAPKQPTSTTSSSSSSSTTATTTATTKRRIDLGRINKEQDKIVNKVANTDRSNIRNVVVYECFHCKYATVYPGTPADASFLKKKERTADYPKRPEKRLTKAELLKQKKRRQKNQKRKQRAKLYANSTAKGTTATATGAATTTASTTAALAVGDGGGDSSSPTTSASAESLSSSSSSSAASTATKQQQDKKRKLSVATTTPTTANSSSNGSTNKKKKKKKNSTAGINTFNNTNTAPAAAADESEALVLESLSSKKRKVSVANLLGELGITITTTSPTTPKTPKTPKSPKTPTTTTTTRKK